MKFRCPNGALQDTRAIRRVVAAVVHVALSVAVGADGAAVAQTAGQGMTMAGMASKHRRSGGSSALGGPGRMAGTLQRMQSMSGSAATNRSNSPANGAGATSPGGNGASRFGGAATSRSSAADRSKAKGASGMSARPAGGRYAPDWSSPPSWSASSLYSSPWQARNVGYSWGATVR